MTTQLFINLPIKDLKQSVDFFSKLGFNFNKQFTDDKGTCMIVNENAFVMLIVNDFFKSFTNKPISDAKVSTETIISLSVANKEEVIQKVGQAVAAGATTPNEAHDYGWMYQWGFQDLDGHLWEVFYLDAAAMPKQ